jgi:hypothetical protein
MVGEPENVAVLRLYVCLLAERLAVGVLLTFQQRALEIAGAGFGEAAAEDGDEILPAKRLRHEFPSLSGAGVADERGGEQRRRIEFGCHDFGQEFNGLLDATLAGFFFFDCEDEVVELFAGGVGEGVKEFQEPFGFGEFAGEGGVDGHEGEETLPRMTRTRPLSSVLTIFWGIVKLTLAAGQTPLASEAGQAKIPLQSKFVALLTTHT